MKKITRKELREMILRGDDISNVDVSGITDMRGMFYNSPNNSDVSGWDVSNVTNMRCMFSNSTNQSDVSGWDVSNVTDMSGMFDNSQISPSGFYKWDCGVVLADGIISQTKTEDKMTDYKKIYHTKSPKAIARIKTLELENTQLAADLRDAREEIERLQGIHSEDDHEEPSPSLDDLKLKCDALETGLRGFDDVLTQEKHDRALEVENLNGVIDGLKCALKIITRENGDCDE